MTESIVSEAIERFHESQASSDHNRETAYNAFKFARLAEQWPEEMKKERLAEGRPCLTINRLPAFIRHIVNQARQAEPAIKVIPVDNGADEDTAEVINGLVRTIERRSKADVAYDTALDHAVTGGFGFFRLGLDYVHPDSFDMEIKVERVPNPLMVHWDVTTTAFDASDWEYAFVSDLLTQTEFERRYPKAKKVEFSGDYRDTAGFWLHDQQIRIAEYWLRKEKREKLLLLSDGTVIPASDFAGDVRALFEVQGVTVAREKTAVRHEVKRRIISGVEILEEDDWPGSTIPVCPVWGEEVNVDGRRYYRSMIEDAIDAQRMFNFWRSATTELVALAPRAPYLIPEGGIPEDAQEEWATANTRSHPYLTYKADTGLPPPQRQPFASVPAGAMQEAMLATDDMKAIMGVHDASLGAQSNEVSGRAIMARQREADVSNFHFIDNLNRAIEYGGKCIVELIPHVYSPGRTIRILGEDAREKVVQLAQQGQGDPGDRLYDIATGIYDVDIKTGPSFATQREETRESLIEVMRSVPHSAAVIGDVLMDHMDFPGADKLAKRLQLMLPAPIQAMEAEANQDPEVAVVVQQAKQAIEQLQGQLQQATQEQQARDQEIERLKTEAAKEEAESQIRAQTNSADKAKFAAQLENQRVGAEKRIAELNATIAMMKLSLEKANVEAAKANLEIDRAQQADPNQTAMAGAMQALAVALETINAPKQVVRNETGEIVGVQAMN